MELLQFVVFDSGSGTVSGGCLLSSSRPSITASVSAATGGWEERHHITPPSRPANQTRRQRNLWPSGAGGPVYVISFVTLEENPKFE